MNTLSIIMGGHSAYLQQVQYRLITIIDEEEVPLAPSMGPKLYGFAIAAMVLMIFLILLFWYLALCRKPQRRIEELDSSKTAYKGWNLKKLKATVAELEEEKASELDALMLETLT